MTQEPPAKTTILLNYTLCNSSHKKEPRRLTQTKEQGTHYQTNTVNHSMNLPEINTTKNHYFQDG